MKRRPYNEKRFLVFCYSNRRSQSQRFVFGKFPEFWKIAQIRDSFFPHSILNDAVSVKLKKEGVFFFFLIYIIPYDIINCTRQIYL